MVERGRSDVRQSAYGARRKLSLAFVLKNLQSGSEQGSAPVHTPQYSGAIEICIAPLYRLLLRHGWRRGDYRVHGGGGHVGQRFGRILAS